MNTHPETSEKARMPEAIKTGAGIALAAGVGAGLMYLLDHKNDRRTKADGRDTIHDLENLANGLATEGQPSVQPEFVEDDELAGRIRTKLSGVVPYPDRIGVTVRDGLVTLDGQVGVDDAPGVVPAVRSIYGVKDVKNYMDVILHSQRVNNRLARLLTQLAAFVGVSGILISRTR